MGLEKKYNYALLSKYRDVLMGIQIILIMIFHFTEDCKAANIRYSGIVYLFYNYIGSSGVDVFLFLSGLGLYYSWKKNPDYQVFYKNRLKRILIPYLLVAIAAWGWYDISKSRLGVIQFVKDVTFVSFFSEGKNWFWYIFMAVVCYILFPWFFQIVEDAQNKGAERVGLISVWTANAVVAILFKLYYSELYLNISIALLRFPAFFAGCMAGKCAYRKQETTVWKPCILFGVTMVLGVLLQTSKQPIMGFYSRAALNISMCLVITVVLESAVKGKGAISVWICHRMEKMLGWFGKYSLELYLIHVMVRKIMNLLGWHTYRISYEGMMLLVTAVLSILLKKITEMILNWMSRKTLVR